MAEFKKGDTVRLNSGGPLMTITNLGDYGPTGPEDGVKCVWFDGSRREEEVFDRAVLKISDNSAQRRVERA
jgi:uncharacterized protein YodC (DUF2158 family)